MNKTKLCLKKLATIMGQPGTRGILLLALVLGLSAFSIRPLFPHRVVAASASPEQFSGERAMTHLPALTREPHPSGSPAQARVCDYLVRELEKIGLETEIQAVSGMENVLGRLHGSGSAGAIVILTHYDTVAGTLGAADNGSTVAALLEVMRALAAGPAPRNDIIALFDDAEEIGPFNGTKAFIRDHPWMKDIRLAISLDSAVAGFISANEVGPENNGWLVHALAEAYTGGGWMSMSGGGEYNSAAFKKVGLPVLALEDNYPYRQKHSAEDIPAIIHPASVQQLGEQTLSVARVLGAKDLSSPWGKQETYFPVTIVRLFVHYPQSWSLPLAIAAALLLILAVGLSLWRRVASWRGLAVAFGSLLLLTVISVVGVSLLQPLLPKLFGWETHLWHEWPEVIPPHGWVAVIGLDLLVLGLCGGAYVFYRRWSKPADVSLAGLLPLSLGAVALAAAEPRAAYALIWPAFIGSLAWIASIMFSRKHESWSVAAAALGAALPVILMLMIMLPGIVMADGMKSLNILAGIEVLILTVLLPAIDPIFGSGRAARRSFLSAE